MNRETDWMLPPGHRDEDTSFAGRWSPLDPAMKPAEAYRLGGLAATEQYDPTPEGYAPFDRQRAADIRAATEREKRAAEEAPWRAKLPASLRDIDFEQAAAADKLIADLVIPQSPLDVGLTIAGGPIGGKALKAGALALGAMFEPSEAEAGVRDPRLWSAISKTMLRKPLDEMAHQYTDVRAPVPTFVHPEQLLGGYGVFTPWDLSAANKTLTHVDDQKLARPVRLHGGVGFPEANPGMAAASEQAISRRLDNQAAALAETGKPVYIMPMTMSPQGIDASHHVADPLSQLVQTAKIKRDDVTAFNDMMREHVPDWVSIKSKNFPDYINNLKGGMTTKALMADRMALAEWQAKGFPDVAAVRHATSEPALIELPRNTAGMAISRYMPGQGLLETTHPSYPKGVAGQYMGQLAELVPFEAAAPDIAQGLAQYNAANKALGKKVASTPAYHLQKPHEGVPTSQYFDDEWLDNIMKLREER